MKKCSASLIIREMQTKTTIRHHFTPVRLAAIKKSTSISTGEGVKKRGPSYTVGGNENQYNHYGEQCGASLENWKENYRVTQQPHCWAYTPRKPELKQTRVPQCSLQHCLQQLECGSNLDVKQQMMDKKVVVHIHNGILLSY